MGRISTRRNDGTGLTRSNVHRFSQARALPVSRSGANERVESARTNPAAGRQQRFVGQRSGRPAPEVANRKHDSEEGQIPGASPTPGEGRRHVSPPDIHDKRAHYPRRADASPRKAVEVVTGLLAATNIESGTSKNRLATRIAFRKRQGVVSQHEDMTTAECPIDGGRSRQFAPACACQAGQVADRQQSCDYRQTAPHDTPAFHRHAGDLDTVGATVAHRTVHDGGRRTAGEGPQGCQGT